MLSAVTGSAGFIGAHLVEALKQRGDRVVELDRRQGTNLLTMPLDFDGVDVVYHLAGKPGVRGSFGPGLAPYLTGNVLATELVLDAAVRAGVPRVVFASSSSVYGSAVRPVTEADETRPESPYGVTKLACEHLCRIAPVETVTLRYFTVYGPGQRGDMAFARFIAAARADRPLTVYGDGSQVRDFTYIGDVIEATITAGERGQGVYNIAGGSQATLAEALEIIGYLAGRELEIDHADPVAGDVRRTWGDTTRAQSELGWTPNTGLEEGLRAQWSQ